MSHLLKRSLLMLALVATLAVAQAGTAVGQLGSGEVRAVVDIGTGELILELGISNQAIGITGGGLDLFDITAFDAGSGLGPAGQLRSDVIGFLGLSPFPAGTFNLGAIIDEPFRSLEGVESLEVTGGAAGLAPIVLTVANGGITVINTAVPEPSSLSLLALASLGVVARRRR